MSKRIAAVSPTKKSVVAVGDVSPSRFIQQVRARVMECLESEFDSFKEDASVEEQRLLIAILNNHASEGTSSQAPRRPGDYEIPLLSAIEREVTGRLCVSLPDDELMGPVNDFIASAVRRRSVVTNQEKESGRARRERLMRTACDIFARDCSDESLSFMEDLMARWNEVAMDEDMRVKHKCGLAVAAETELSAFRAELAAKEAIQPVA